MRYSVRRSSMNVYRMFKALEVLAYRLELWWTLTDEISACSLNEQMNEQFTRNQDIKDPGAVPRSVEKMTTQR